MINLVTRDLSGESIEDQWPHVVLTIGSFDGVHRGHQRILEEVSREARTRGGTAAVLTMQPHPREFFSPAHAPNLLTSHAKKVRLLEEAGMDVVFVLDFNDTVAALSPRAFTEEIIKGRCRAEALIVGHDFRFGHDASGDYHLLAGIAEEYGLAVRQVMPLQVGGERVSSTLIRERILEGDLEEVEVFLGRKYSIIGEVVHGRGIGTHLGFPTANVSPHHSALPAHGAYAAEVEIEGSRFPAAVNIGIAPTIRNENVTIEAFVLDYSADILGKIIEIVFHKRLRPEQKFASHEALIAQIHRDVAAVRSYFAQTGSADRE